jgi:tRNA modification GTPase
MWVEDTIAAIATPLGEGGLAVVRLSGAQALTVADQVFVPSGGSEARPSTFASHTLHHGRIVRQGQVVDEALMAVMRAPRTYTREHVVEFSCHGGLLVARMVLDVLLEHGARLALPGEFTRRAFLNGRVDLAQAEAVADLIHSRTELALVAANEQLAGRLSQRINRLRDDLMQSLAHVEAHIDFPEEDIAPDTRTQLVQRLNQAQNSMEDLLRTAHEGQILRRGIRTAIIGRPNVGKSSLLNLLLGHDRAIVSPHPGTTRDTIEESVNIRGLPVVFIDTAGMRSADNAIESEGIQRSRRALEKAELVLLVLDASEPVTLEDHACVQLVGSRKHIVVLNKTDLPSRLVLPSDLLSTTPRPTVPVSCVSGEGLETLKDAIKEAVWAGEIKPAMLQVVINARHQDALRRARDATLTVVEALTTGQSLELVAVDLRLAANAVGEIVGRTSTEDLLDSIFSQFCIGK